MKKILLLLMALVAMLSASAEWFIPAYDVDKDGSINISDLTILIDRLLRAPYAQEYDGDTNYDGNVSIADVTTLIDYLLSDRESDQYFDPKYRPAYPEIIIPDGAEVFTVNGVSFAMVPVDTVDANGNVVRKMSIGLTEVTDELWTAVMGTSPLPDPLLRVPCPRWPVNTVSFYDCENFIDRLNELTGKTFRLPTIDEWLYAAHGALLYHDYQYAGSDVISEVGWILNTIPKNNWYYFVCPVGTKAPNELGIYDMTGNVAEWTVDSVSHETPPVQKMRLTIGGDVTCDGWHALLNNSLRERYCTEKDLFFGLRLAL